MKKIPDHKRKQENISIDMLKAITERNENKKRKRQKKKPECLHKKYEDIIRALRLTSLEKVPYSVSLQTSRISTLMDAMK